MLKTLVEHSKKFSWKAIMYTILWYILCSWSWLGLHFLWHSSLDWALNEVSLSDNTYIAGACRWIESEILNHFRQVWSLPYRLVIPFLPYKKESHRANALFLKGHSCCTFFDGLNAEWSLQKNWIKIAIFGIDSMQEC